MMILRPQGLLPERRRKMELTDDDIDDHRRDPLHGTRMSATQAPTPRAVAVEPRDPRRDRHHQAVRRPDRRQRRHVQRCPSARSSRSSGPTARARRRSSTCSRASTSPTIGHDRRSTGRNITGARPDMVMKAGMARTFQNIRLFSTMTAIENVMVGEHSRMKAGLFGSILPHAEGAARGGRERARRRARSSTYVGIADALARPAGDQPLLRRPAPGGDRPRAGVRPEGPAARRADGGHEPAGVGRADGRSCASCATSAA